MTDDKSSLKTPETKGEAKIETRPAAESGTRNAAPVLKAVETASSAKAAVPAKARKAKPVKKVKKTAKAGKINVRKAAKPAAGKATTSKEKTMTQGKYQYDRLTQDAVNGNKEQMDAALRAGTVFFKGFEDMTKACMSLAQSSAEKNSQAVKALMSCKTINEFAETQNKWAQQNFDDFMAGATKLSELGVRVATEALEPINDQFSKGLKKAADKMAA